MKKMSVFILAGLLGLSSFCQNEITLDFGLLQNGSQLVLDSVLIENQTSGSDTIIYDIQDGLVIDFITKVDDLSSQNLNKLTVNQNYPNPCSDGTIVEAYIPGQEVSIKLFDTTGKLLTTKTYRTGRGYQIFGITPGNSGQYILKISCKGQEESIVITSNSNNKNTAEISWNGETDIIQPKSTKSVSFTYYHGDILEFTGYVTACQTAASTSFTDSPIESQTYDFDFTYIIEIQPDAALVGEITTTETSIDWNWSSVPDALGYKYNFVEDYETALDNALINNFSQTELTAGTNYKLFVWAYNECGSSFSTELNKATTALPLTQAEIDLILSEASTVAMEVMNICEQPDSIILRSLSTNVIVGEENLSHLTDRMKKTVTGIGVGIAAPQVGINRRIIWVQRYDIGSVIHPWGLYFNPRIVNYSDTVALRSDGCLSVPDPCETEYSITGNSYRALWIDVEYYLADGTYVIERINQQYTAHIFQHEIDHLDGIMFFDRQVEENPEKFTVVKGDSYEGLPVID